MPGENVETAESSKEQKFSKAVNEGIKLGIDTVKERFQNPNKPEDNLEYHKTDHSNGVVKGVEDILTAIHKVNPDLVSKRDIDLGKLIASYHDEVQIGEKQQIPDQKNDGKVMLKFVRRPGGANEKASADELKEYMNKVNKEQGEQVFNEKDKQTADEAIMLTVPNFDMQKGTVTQPGFGEKSMIAQALALSDLAVAGRGKLEDAKNDAASLIIEENPDIAALNKQSIQNMSPEDQNWYKGRIVGFLKFQNSFIPGRKAQTAEDIGTMHPDAQKALKDFFPNFDANAQGMKEFAEAESGKNLAELITDLRNIVNPKAEEEKILQKIDIHGDNPDAAVKAIANDQQETQKAA